MSFVWLSDIQRACIERENRCRKSFSNHFESIKRCLAETQCNWPNLAACIVILYSRVRIGDPDKDSDLSRVMGNYPTVITLKRPRCYCWCIPLVYHPIADVYSALSHSSHKYGCFGMDRPEWLLILLNGANMMQIHNPSTILTYSIAIYSRNLQIGFELTNYLNIYDMYVMSCHMGNKIQT